MSNILTNKEIKRRDRYCPNRPRFLFLKQLRKKYRVTLRVNPSFLNSQNNNLRLFLLPRCARDTPDKGKNLRYPQLILKEQ